MMTSHAPDSRGLRDARLAADARRARDWVQATSRFSNSRKANNSAAPLYIMQ